MEAPRYVQEELASINSMFFAVFNPNIEDGKNMSHRKARWQIRKWQGIYPKPLRLWREFSEPIMTICKEEVTDDGLIDAGYEDLDRRVITAIKMSNRWKDNYKKNLDDMDWRNERRRRQAHAQFEYESKYAAKRIWRHLHEPTVHQSGRWDYYKG